MLCMPVWLPHITPTNRTKASARGRAHSFSTGAWRTRGLDPRPGPTASRAEPYRFLAPGPGKLPFFSMVTWATEVGRRTRAAASKKQKCARRRVRHEADSPFEQVVEWQRRECVRAIECCESEAKAVQACNREPRIQGGEVRGFERRKERNKRIARADHHHTCPRHSTHLDFHRRPNLGLFHQLRQRLAPPRASTGYNQTPRHRSWRTRGTCSRSLR